MAAEAGKIDAASYLGLLLEKRGERVEAQRWWRMAAEAGDTEAAYDLGLLLKDLGELGEAEAWYRTAAAAGNTVARSSRSTCCRPGKPPV